MSATLSLASSGRKPFSARIIAAHMARHIFERKCLVIVPQCYWTGYECDLLGVTNNLRVIDVEIKISRADLKADAKKDKWFHLWDAKLDGPWNTAPRRPRQWPKKVWKHYYCMPGEIWKSELLETINPASGILLLKHVDINDRLAMEVVRNAKPNRDADHLTAEDAIDLARLASLRMWDAYDAVDNLRKYYEGSK